MSIDRAAFNQGENAKYDISIDESGIAPTVVARGASAVGVFWNEEEICSTLTANNAGGGNECLIRITSTVLSRRTRCVALLRENAADCKECQIDGVMMFRTRMLPNTKCGETEWLFRVYCMCLKMSEKYLFVENSTS